MKNISINGKTGAELEALLIEMNFEVPEIQPYEPTPYPPYIPAPARPNFADPVAKAQWIADFLAYQTQMKANIPIRAQIKAENDQKLAAYFEQFDSFAMYLSTIFDPMPNYTFLQLAHRLMGYACQRPADPITFLAY